MKRTNSTMGNAIFLATSKVITTLSGIITTKILSNTLDLMEYGTYSQALLLVSVSASLISCGLSDCVSFFYNRSDGDEHDKTRQNQLHTIFAIEVFLGLVVFGVLCIGQNQIVEYFSNPQLGGLMVLIGLRPMLDNSIYLYQVLFASIGKSELIAKRHLFLSIAKLAGVYFSAVILRDLRAVLLVLLVLDIIQIVAFAIIFGRVKFWILPWKLIPELAKEILAYGLPMGLFSITNGLSRDFDKFVIGYFAGPEASAIYANCSRSLPIDILAVSIATILVPRIVYAVQNGRRAEAAAIFHNYVRVGYYSVWCFAAVILVFSDEVISFLYSDSYLLGKSVFILYIVDNMVRFSSLHLVMTAAGQTKKLFMYSLITLAANGVLDVLLYHLIGFTGPAFATVFTTGLYTIMVLKSTCSVLEVRLKSLVSWKEIMRLIIILIGGSTGTCVVKKYFLSWRTHPYVAMILGMILYLIYFLVVNRKQIREIWEEINAVKIPNY